MISIAISLGAVNIICTHSSSARQCFLSFDQVRSGKPGRKPAPAEKEKVKPGQKVKQVKEPELEPEVEEPRARSRRAGKNRSYSEFYNQ